MVCEVSCEDLERVAVRAGKLLTEKGLKVSPAESCTGGLIAKILTDIPGSSNFFECGVVSYSNRIKASVLGVSEATLEEKTAVSEDVAVQMAEGIRKLSGADIGVSVTGVAGPGSDGDHPEGEIYIALASDCKHTVKKLMTNTNGMREYNRNLAAFTSLEMIVEYLENLAEKE